MAPSPEYDKEPKAPDKSTTNSPSDDSKVLHNLVNDQPTNSDHKPTNSTSNVDMENNKHVEALDDGQLRALLDEAITYKCPKDREGKSSLFKELLEEVEQDEQECEEAARTLSGTRGARRGARSRRALPHSNSLQDLVAALAADAPPRRHHVRHPQPQPAPSNVSARAIHGGSLPSGVDTSSLLSEEPARGAGYLATVRCVNPPPLVERRVSASDANAPTELEVNRRSKPMFPMTYTARATLEIGSGSVCSGRAVTTTTASNQVDSAIPFSCITTPEVVDSCNTTSSTSQAAVAIDPKPLQLGSSYCAVASVTGVAPQPRSRSPTPDRAANTQQPDGQRAHPHQPRSVISSSFNGLPLSRPNYGSTGTTAPDEFKKSLDENGNSVQGFSSPLSGSSQHKKPRRKKSSKNETVIDCRQIDGYQGDKDVNELLRFIESNPDNGRGHKLSRAKHRDDADEKGKKRPPERAHRKDKEAKVQRATSMEELSRTTIEELTAGAGPPPAPPLRADKKERRDHAAVKAERRSWGDDGRAPFYYADAPAADTAAAIATELTDFQTVTKKRKPRRRADDNDRDAAPRRTRLPSPRARRESAPPSDRSNDSNDDMDSVHSLPADATPVGRDAPAPAAPRPSAPPAPHASYAEIARTRHNIPDLIESCNFYAEGENGGEQRRAPEPPAPVASDADGYPALEPRATTGAPPAEAGVARRPRDPKVAAAAAAAAAGRRERKDRGVGGAGGGPAGAEAPAPDVVADRRPPVILLDSTVRPRDMDGVTFGFDINEQLLGAAARRPRCDLVRDAVEGAAGVAVRAGCAALRYLPPQPPPDTHHLHQIVDYVGGAWEDIVRCSGGKVRYFSE